MAGSNIVYPNSSHSGDFGAAALNIDFRQLVNFIRRRMPIIAGCILLTTVLSIIIVSQLQEKFTATAQVMINPQKRSVVDLDQGGQTNIVSDAAFIGSQVRILMSRTLAERLVEKLNLAQDPEFNPALESKQSFLDSIVGFINPLNWIPSGSGPADDGVVESPSERERRRMNAIVDTVLGKIEAERDGLSYIIGVKATSRSPVRAAELANTLVELYLVDELEWRAQTVKRTNAWLDDELSELRDKLTVSESAAEQFRADNDLLAVEGKTNTEEQRIKLSAQLSIANAELAEKEARFKRMQGLRSRGAAETAAEVLNSPIIAGLRAQQAALVRERGNLRNKYGDRHPTLLNIQAEISDLNRQIGLEVDRIIANIENEVGVAEVRVKSLEDSLKLLENQSAVDDKARIKLKELEREATANQDLYNSLLQGFKKSSVLATQSSIDPFARKLSEAATPQSPSFPRVKLIVVMAFFGGAALGLAIAFLAEALDDGISTSDQVESQLMVPHLASIPMLTRREYIGKNSQKKIHDYLLDKPLSEFTESFRHLRSAFALMNVDNPPKVIMVSSSLPHEGKTTVSLCLARSASIAGLKTLLIDADLRNPAVSARVKRHEIDQGLVEVLAGKCKLDDVLIKDQSTPLDIVPTVALVTASSDVLNSQAMGHLLEKARSTYDLIIVDSAPTLLVADTTNLARHVDACAFVVHWDTTPKRAALTAVKKLKTTGVPYVGAVLSQVDVRRLKSYGKGDDAYYMSKYSVYYADS